MSQRHPKIEKHPVGLQALLTLANHPVPRPIVAHFAAGKTHSERHDQGQIDITIPTRSAPDGIRGHLLYALRNEALDMRVWHAIVHFLGPRPFQEWILEEPTSRHARRAWFLFEYLTGKTLPVPDAQVSNYVPIADEALQLTSRPHRNPRYKVIDNLLGSPEFCPLVRNTEAIRSAQMSGLSNRVMQTVAEIEPRDLQRATDYLYHKETKASFLIEREDVSATRMERFVTALRAAQSTHWYEEKQLAQLQNSIVDARYIENGYRAEQVYIGQTMPWGEECVHYPCPKPTDVRSLMAGWRQTLSRTMAIDPVCQAAIMGFGFVFIHPFEDGNGRIHRFVIHATLTRRHFSPSDVIIPVSATMLRRKDQYDETLERHSKPLLKFIDFRLDEEGVMTVQNDTVSLYRYWDATPQCEYLWAALAEAIDVDLPEELKALRAYDAGRAALIQIVDMPDRRADLLMQFLIQNSYRLSKTKRIKFPELKDAEIAQIEQAVRDAAAEAL